MRMLPRKILHIFCCSVEMWSTILFNFVIVKCQEHKIYCYYYLSYLELNIIDRLLVRTENNNKEFHFNMTMIFFSVKEPPKLPEQKSGVAGSFLLELKE